MLERLRRLLPGAWLGLLAAIGLIAAPAAFGELPRADAGRVNARLFLYEAWASVGLALLLWLPERGRARARASRGQGSVLSAEMILLLGTLLCTFGGYFAVQTLLPAARAGQGPLSFGQLHLISVVLYGAKSALVATLAWRAAATP